MGYKKLRGEMTPTELAAARRKAKYADCLLKAGRPTLVPAAPAHEHLAALAERGMDARDMAKQSGMSVTTCRDLIRGRRPDKHGVQGKPLKKLYRDTVERALTVTFQEPETSEVQSGPRTNGIGTARRVQAMMANGFSLRVVAGILGTSEQWTWQLAIHRWPLTLTRTAKSVAEMYEKYQHVDPFDYGLTKFAVSRAKSAANRRGYAPSYCWDEDTIDDPEAKPEWTGACGTEEGYRIHIRETLQGKSLPLCMPCREAVETRPAGPQQPVFRRDEFDRLLTEAKLSPRALAEHGYGDVNIRETLYAWRTGRRTPRTMRDIERLADALRVDVEVLLDREAMHREASKPVVGHGQFNPYVLGVVLDLSGLSYNATCNLPGANYSTGALSKWVSGAMKPSEPEKLQPIADHFGIDVEVFYQ